MSQTSGTAPIEAHVRKSWDEIFLAINEGLSIEYQIADLEEYLERLQRAIDLKETEDSEKIDFEMGCFVNEYNLRNNLKYFLDLRKYNLTLNRDMANRIGSVADDFLKFGVKTLILSHGAVCLALVAGLFQNPTDQAIVFIRELLIFSIGGLGAALIATIVMIYMYQHLSSKYYHLSRPNASYSEMSKFHSRDKVTVWITRIFIDLPMMISLSILLVQIFIGWLRLPSFISPS